MRAAEARISSCARTFTIDWETRSAKLRSLTSAPGGNGSPCGRSAVSAPTSLPFTITGDEMAQRSPSSLDFSFMRVERPVSSTPIVALSGAGW